MYGRILFYWFQEIHYFYDVKWLFSENVINKYVRLLVSKSVLLSVGVSHFLWGWEVTLPRASRNTGFWKNQYLSPTTSNLPCVVLFIFLDDILSCCWYIWATGSSFNHFSWIKNFLIMAASRGITELYMY